ncbi:MAG: OmpA family protein [Acidobacteriota bacterium]
MKSHLMLVLSAASFLSIAACHKAVPVVARQPLTNTPVAAAAPSTPRSAFTATPSRSAVPTAAASKPQATVQQRPAVMTPQDRATLEQRLAHMEDALFDYNKTTIRPDASGALKDDVSVIRDILAAYPAQKLLIEGYADERGSDEYNLALGDKRARAAKQFLQTAGISENQLNVISFGKERSVCTDSTEACWQKNRRAHITASR